MIYFNEHVKNTRANYFSSICYVSAAFDTVDHKILIDWLQNWVGISGTALKWFCSYLMDQILYVETQCFPPLLCS